MIFTAFYNASLSGAFLVLADLSEADLRGAIAIVVNFNDAIAFLQF